MFLKHLYERWSQTGRDNIVQLLSARSLSVMYLTFISKNSLYDITFLNEGNVEVCNMLKVQVIIWLLLKGKLKIVSAWLCYVHGHLFLHRSSIYNKKGTNILRCIFSLLMN